jgi:hypothetical protein
LFEDFHGLLFSEGKFNKMIKMPVPEKSELQGEKGMKASWVGITPSKNELPIQKFPLPHPSSFTPYCYCLLRNTGLFCDLPSFGFFGI